MLRPFSLHPALGQALMHGATLPDSAAAAMTKGLSRQLLSRMVGVGSRYGLLEITNQSVECM